MFAVMMLLLSGGVFAHADSMTTSAVDCHSGSEPSAAHTGESPQTDGCKSSAPSQSLHCGAHILLVPTVAVSSDTNTDDTPTDWPVVPLIDRSNTLDPPPPKYPSSLV
ncbi:MAG: hypothetical protein JJ920_13105 [Roseitalea sp.]|nr:hypothetical protein [Roseitalea sp.]MBO6720697.1 hypothetical protein [Roseitalea sp.]MBO6743844.1 hypothetical protein [Roseitalea sp.]